MTNSEITDSLTTRQPNAPRRFDHLSAAGFYQKSLSDETRRACHRATVRKKVDVQLLCSSHRKKSFRTEDYIEEDNNEKAISGNFFSGKCFDWFYYNASISFRPICNPKRHARKARAPKR